MFIRSQNEPYLPLPSQRVTHLPSSEVWKAELAWMAGYVVRQFIPARR